MTGPEVAFALLGALAVGAGALAVTTTRAVRAAVWLAITLAAVAGCFLVLAAELVAWIHVLVYVGAVVGLLLFALMLTRVTLEPGARAAKGRSAMAGVVAGVVAAATAAVLLVSLLGAFGRERIEMDGAPAGTAEAIGGALFGGWVLPFEALSLLLLAALVGAVALSRPGDGPPGDGAPGDGPPGDLSGRTTRRPGRSRTSTLTSRDGTGDGTGDGGRGGGG